VEILLVKRPTIDFLLGYSDEAILEELKRIESTSGTDTVTKAQIKNIGRVIHSVIVTLCFSCNRGQRDTVG
jgi:hypothetical protein